MNSMQRVVKPELKADPGLVKDRTQSFKNGYMNGLIGMDDAFQSFIRQRLLQLGAENDISNPAGPLPDGSKLKAVREFLGNRIFAQSPGGRASTTYMFDDGEEAKMIGARALQAGVLSGAGLGTAAALDAMLGGDRNETELPMY
jgi:hypothetical protein